MQNYLVWRLVLDRISSLSQRFKDARANYRKVSDALPLHRAWTVSLLTLTTCCGPSTKVHPGIRAVIQAHETRPLGAA